MNCLRVSWLRPKSNKKSILVTDDGSGHEYLWPKSSTLRRKPIANESWTYTTDSKSRVFEKKPCVPTYRSEYRNYTDLQVWWVNFYAKVQLILVKMGSAFPTIQSWLLTINLKEHTLKMADHYEAMLFSNCSIFSIRMCLVYKCRYYLGLCSIIFFFTNRMLLFIPMTSFESMFTFSKICFLPIYQIISMGSHKRHNLSYQDTSSFEIVPSRTAMEIR